MSTERRTDWQAMLPAAFGGAFAMVLGAVAIWPALHDADLADRRSAELAAVAKRVDPPKSRAVELERLAEGLRAELPPVPGGERFAQSTIERWSGDFAALWRTLAERESGSRLRGLRLERTGERVVLEIEADVAGGATTR